MNLNSEPRNATMCMSKAGLAVGTSGATIDIAAPNGAGVDFCIKGIMYHKADTASIAVTASTVQAISTSCLYLVCLNSSGTLSTVKGTAVLTADYTSGNAVLRWPDVPADKCAIGAFKVDCDSTHTFTAGTTELGATGITDTYYDFCVVPAAPLSA